jgi:hypothetical protein
MNVVGHHNPGMEFEMPPFAPKNGFDHYGSNLGPARKSRSRGGIIQKRVHGDESLSGSKFFGKAAPNRQSPVQTPGRKNCLANRITMRKIPSKRLNHTDEAASASGVLIKFSRPIANRPQVWPLAQPHGRPYPGQDCSFRLRTGSNLPHL